MSHPQFSGRSRKEGALPAERPGDAQRGHPLEAGAAGIPYIVEEPDGPLYADFHALRHPFISMLERNGVSIKQAQVLARHPDPKLTIGRYSHATLTELGNALGRLPALTEAAGSKPGLLDALPRSAVEALAWVALAMLSPSLDAPRVAPLVGTEQDEAGQRGMGLVDGENHAA
jgi:hypothetical protein